jgi:uroporphyrin-III C-methyltransferase
MDGNLAYAPPELAPGSVWLVGAGPGDPGLVSLLAVTAFRVADAVIHDAAVTPEILALIPAGKLVQRVGPSGFEGAVERCVALARDGWRVVRLVEGDPLATNFGAAAASAISEAGVACRVVPGIAAAKYDTMMRVSPISTLVDRATEFSMVGVAG